ncbi:MAG: hypothetical protein AB7F86_20555 [Bdellovibrionales bacterium]
MTQFFTVLALLVAANVASANDSAFPKITVKGINPGEVKLGQKIEIYGKNADVFFEMLPNSLVAASKEENHELAKKYRSLSLVSKAYSLNIWCDKVDQNGHPLAIGTHCTVELARPYTDGDGYEVAPICSQEHVPDWL